MEARRDGKGKWAIVPIVLAQTVPLPPIDDIRLPLIGSSELMHVLQLVQFVPLLSHVNIIAKQKVCQSLEE
jgi:hypothetical protein